MSTRASRVGPGPNTNVSSHLHACCLSPSVPLPPNDLILTFDKDQKNLKGKKHVNSYKSLRLIGKGYDIMYAVQCHKNAHELYNMNKDPGQMRNLHPTAPAESGHKNPFHSGENQLAGYDIERLLTRVDALLLVLKSCKGNACVKPWKELHHDGNVNNLRDAMNQTFEDKYSKLHKHKKVRFY